MPTSYDKTTVKAEWGALLTAAEAYFDTAPQKEHQYHQCIVLCTADGEQILLPSAADSVDALKNQACLALADSANKRANAAVQKMICMWENRIIDAPAFDYMKKLCEINEENRKTLVLLCGGADLYHAKSIADMIGCFLRPRGSNITD